MGEEFEVKYYNSLQSKKKRKELVEIIIQIRQNDPHNSSSHSYFSLTKRDSPREREDGGVLRKSEPS